MVLMLVWLELTLGFYTLKFLVSRASILVSITFYLFFFILMPVKIPFTHLKYKQLGLPNMGVVCVYYISSILD